MSIIAFEYSFVEQTETSAVRAPSSDQISKVGTAIDSTEWLVMRYRGGCQMFLVTDKAADAETLWQVLQKNQIVPSRAQKKIAALREQQAVQHFLQIATGIATTGGAERLMEVLREAYTQAVELGYVGTALHRLFQRGVWLHEKARMETDYFRFAVQEESVLRELAGKIFGKLQSTITHVVGDDENLPKFIDELYFGGCRKFVFFWDESQTQPALAAKVNGQVRPYQEAQQALTEADLALLFEPPTKGGGYSEKAVAQRMSRRNNAPLLVLDMAGSFCQTKTLHKVYNLYCYSQVDIRHVIAHNKSAQKLVAEQIDRWLSDEVASLFEWIDSDARHQFAGIIGSTPQMHRIFELISRIAQSNITVIIDGESGTGKELVARAIHQLSMRADKPFVVVNCGAIPENLLESELFGHVRGAFTGAIANKSGLFELANLGTIFLDEIGELSPQLQVKLLRFLQEGEIKRVGSNDTLKADVRVLAASNKDLESLVEAGAFRSDLFYRLNVIRLTLPPLRERANDIPLLSQHFLNYFAKKLQKEVVEIAPQAMQALMDSPWPGNVRELEHVLERAVALAVGKTISIYDLPTALQDQKTRSANHTSSGRLTLKELEKNHIIETLDACNWNYDLASKQLGIGRTTLWRKLREYKVNHS